MRRDTKPFDLELAIQSWRKGLRHWGAFLLDDLDELELHLRDHTAGLVQQGMDEREAFEVAQAQMGDLAQMERAYRAVFWRKLRFQRRLLTTLAEQAIMFRSYATVAFRSLARHRGYSALNITGLAVGLACAFLIVLWIQSELSVDQFHEKGADLYQVRINDTSGDAITHVGQRSISPGPDAGGGIPGG